MKNFSYSHATSIKEAIEQANTSGSMYIAGGTNLV